MTWPDYLVNKQILDQLIKNYQNQPTFREDEKRFLIDFYNANKHVKDGEPNEISPRDLIQSTDFYIEPKRAWYILNKWFAKDIYESGTSSDLGWLTAEGERFAAWLAEQ